MSEKQKQKQVSQWTREEFESLPLREWNENIGEFTSLIILPTRRIHDSGFRNMDFVAVKEDIPVCRLSGCSDVLHLDGIGGYGQWNGSIPDSIPPKGWSIDCLKTSGLLRLFSRGKLKVGQALSSFEIFSEK
ncbi:MAG TPA: hypothetical protein VE868_02070 [Balneolaceae bacterium]|nr:hypothetical protein [Balneolaceae bacterium]